MRSNSGTCINQTPLCNVGDKIFAGDVLADGPATDKGEIGLGKNVLVAFMPWEGHNYEDAIILSQRLVQDDVLSSIHIEEHEVDARDTKLGPEEITRDIPNLSDEILAAVNGKKRANQELANASNFQSVNPGTSLFSIFTPSLDSLGGLFISKISISSLKYQSLIS